jgi:plastocyanin
MLRLVPLLGSLLVATATFANGDPGTPPRTHTVTIENMQFNPAELSVHAGDRIAWVNNDLVPHTATAEDKSFDSGSIEANGASWTYTIEAAGVHAYKCAFHPTMHARVTVQ